MNILKMSLLIMCAMQTAALFSSAGFRYKIVNNSDIPITGRLIYTANTSTPMLCPKPMEDFTLQQSESVCLSSAQTLTNVTCCLSRINFNDSFDRQPFNKDLWCKDLKVTFQKDTTGTLSARYEPLTDEC
jgi:hypothetical protein